MVVLQVWYRIIVPTDYFPSPRYFTITFSIERRRPSPEQRAPNPEKMILYEQARQLRAAGLGFTEIARNLGISLGTAWNAINLYCHESEAK